MTPLLESYYTPHPQACVLLATFYTQLRTAAKDAVIEWNGHSQAILWFPHDIVMHRIEFATQQSILFGTDHPQYAGYQWEWGCRIYFQEGEQTNSVVILLPFLKAVYTPLPQLLVENPRGSVNAEKIAAALIISLNKNMARQLALAVPEE